MAVDEARQHRAITQIQFAQRLAGGGSGRGFRIAAREDLDDSAVAHDQCRGAAWRFAGIRDDAAGAQDGDVRQGRLQHGGTKRERGKGEGTKECAHLT